MERKEFTNIIFKNAAKTYIIIYTDRNKSNILSFHPLKTDFVNKIILEHLMNSHFKDKK